MFNRKIETHQEDFFDDLDNAREYARNAEKSAKRRFDGFLKVLHLVNIKGNYLEVGAGSGILATMIVEKYNDVQITATDSSATMLTIAKEYIDNKSLNDRIQLMTGNIEDDEFIKKLGYYDLIYSTFSLHHWKNPTKIISKLMDLLNENGALILYDLKRVWWLYWIPKQSGFFKSIRAAYTTKEIKQMLNGIGITNYTSTTVIPFFLQNITILKSEKNL